MLVHIPSFGLKSEIIERFYDDAFDLAVILVSVCIFRVTAVCKHCLSPWHLAPDCYVPVQIRQRGLAVDDEGYPHNCRVCQSFEHPTSKCEVWKHFKTCAFCGGDHETLSCPSRMTIEGQKSVEAISGIPPTCKGCACKGTKIFNGYGNPVCAKRKRVV